MRVVIVDDEPLGRLAVRQHLAGISGAEVVAECSEGKSAIEAIVRESPDVVFLDVQMPGLSGFDVLEGVGSEAVPAVVFVTAFDRYAVRAFEAHAVDYLLKPIDPDRFREAYVRAATAADREARERTAGRLEALLERLAERPRETSGPLERLVVRHDGRLLFVPVSGIEWVEAAGNYVKLHAGPAVYVMRQTMERLAARLGERFVRIRRSALVNVAAIRALEPHGKGSYAVFLKDGTELVSSRYAGRGLRRLADQGKDGA
jgi:two-component system LytT family response regulator